MLELVELARIERSAEGTFGVLKVNGKSFCLTCERPWEDNRPNVSCIPEGTYICEKVDSPHFGVTYKVRDVPGRSNILLHKGNTISDSKGCILPGRKFGKVSGERGVLESTSAFNDFMKAVRKEEHFALTIRNI